MKKKLQQLREEARKRILDFLSRHELDILYADDLSYSAPIMIAAVYDANDSYILDELGRKKKPDTDVETIFFEMSSCDDNISKDLEDIDTETLVDVVEWLEKNENHLEKDS